MRDIDERGQSPISDLWANEAANADASRVGPAAGRTEEHQLFNAVMDRMRPESEDSGAFFRGIERYTAVSGRTGLPIASLSRTQERIKWRAFSAPRTVSAGTTGEQMSQFDQARFGTIATRCSMEGGPWATPHGRERRRTTVRACTQRGFTRFEVMAHESGRDLIRTLARGLAEEGPEAEQVRVAVKTVIAGEPSKHGAILTALRRSPLVGADLIFPAIVKRGARSAREALPSRHQHHQQRRQPIAVGVAAGLDGGAAR